MDMLYAFESVTCANKTVQCKIYRFFAFANEHIVCNTTDVLEHSLHTYNKTCHSLCNIINLNKNITRNSCLKSRLIELFHRGKNHFLVYIIHCTSNTAPQHLCLQVLFHIIKKISCPITIDIS